MVAEAVEALATAARTPMPPEGLVVIPVVELAVALLLTPMELTALAPGAVVVGLSSMVMAGTVPIVGAQAPRRPAITALAAGAVEVLEAALAVTVQVVLSVDRVGLPVAVVRQGPQEACPLW